MAASVHIPPELYEAILDELDGDTPSLRQCALVCQLFSGRAQKLIFKRIVLGRPFRIFTENIISISSPADKFHDHLIKFPHLRKLVQELVITDDRNMKYYHEDKSWIRRDRTIAKILLLLDELEELVIEGNLRGNRLNFEAWRPELKSGIMLKAQSLFKLSLIHMRNVPLLLLNNVPRLRVLTLVKVVFAPYGFPTVTPSDKAELKLLDIKTFAVQEWCTIYPWLQSVNCALDLTRLTTLSLYVDSANINSRSVELEAITRLIQGCANSVKDLYLYFSEDVSIPPFYDDTYINLGILPSLRKLFVEGCVWSPRSSSPTQNGLSWIVNNLQKIPPNFEWGRIVLFLTIEDFEDLPQSGFADACWDEFDKIIRQLSLKTTVNVVFSVDDAYGTYVKNFLGQRLEYLCEHEIVVFGYGIDPYEKIGEVVLNVEV